MYTLLWPKVAILYPIILLTGALLNFFFSEDTLTYIRKNVYLFNSKNVVNQIFAYKGNFIWGVLFIFLSWTQLIYRTQGYDLLSRDNESSVRDKRWMLIRQYAWKFFLKNILLYIIFFFIDHIFIITGGRCTSGSGTSSAETCKLQDGKWVGGFDISGHFCFLMNISCVLWSELTSFLEYIKQEELEDNLKKLYRFGINAIIVTLYIWMSLIFVTALFYHTLLEKILGCALGYVCPVVMYYVIPNNNLLNEFFYC